MEQELSGGNMEPVVRIDDTVRRVAGPWTPAVHALLAACESGGVDAVPKALGIDERGREIVTFLDGEVLADAAPEVLWSDDVLVAAAALLRRIHDASVALVDDETLRWRSPRRAPAEVICHNDFATYNLIVCDAALVGAIDFDFASPGPRIWDLAYLAYRIVPLAEDAPHADGIDRERRLERLIDAYGVAFTAHEVVRVAADRLDDLATFTRERARETGRGEFLDHAAMYERDAARLRQVTASGNSR